MTLICNLFSTKEAVNAKNRKDSFGYLKKNKKRDFKCKDTISKRKHLG